MKPIKLKGDWNSAMILDILIDHGDSGGPVIDTATGKVVGILVGGYRPNDVVYVTAVPATAFCRLLTS